MRLFIHAAAALLVLFASATMVTAQHVPELEPRPGEQRLNRFQYIGSHNSFQRPRPGTVNNLISLREQIDDWGMRHLELDVWWSADHNAYVTAHNCIDTLGATLFTNTLADLASSQDLRNTFVYVNLDMGFSGGSGALGGCFSQLSVNWANHVRDLILQHFSIDEIYTAADFTYIDQQRWPSQQELIRRGKHITFGADRVDIVGTPISYEPMRSFFLRHAHNDDPGGFSNRAEIRSGTHSNTYNLGDRFVSTYYPSAGTCAGELFSQWNSAVESGYTFPTTYCLTDLNRHEHLNLHLPNPLYVRHQFTDPTMLGTRGKPLRSGLGLGAGLMRMNVHQNIKGPSMVEFRIEGGTYNVSAFAPSAPMRVRAASRLVRDGGTAPVRITR